MSKTEEQRAKALRLIREARKTQATELDLSLLHLIQRLPIELAELTALRSLHANCHGCTDLTPLQELPELQSLGLSGFYSLADLTALAGSTALLYLHLSDCSQLADLRPLAGLTALESLGLMECSQITDLTPLLKLPALKILRIWWLDGPLQFALLEPLLPQLEELRLAYSVFTDLPSEVYEEQQNSIDSVRAYYADLKAGATMDRETKLILLGNGSAGKTQLCRRLRGKPYDDKVTTTHGIEVHETTIKLEEFDDPVPLNIWDFGGQEIYHGTHALFIGGRAIFVILWTPELEAAAASPPPGTVIRNRPLSYWLDYVRSFAGTKNPVIVVQSKCDTTAHDRPLPEGAKLDDFALYQIQRVSALNDLRLRQVNGAVEEAIRGALKLVSEKPIGIGRVRVRRRLPQLLAEDPERYRLLERAEFGEICEQDGGVSNPKALLEFLHNCGAIFWNENLFDGKIVLDQNWALAAVYTVFERGKTLPLIRALNGRFTQALLSEHVWGNYKPDEQKVFLGMMESCGVCFKAGLDENGETEYVTPELLPSQSEAQRSMINGRVPVSQPDAEARVPFVFLHEGILRNFLSSIGRHAGDAPQYWKYGCWFYEQTTDSYAIVQGGWDNPQTETGRGNIRLRAWGSKAAQLLEPLIEELRNTRIGRQTDPQPAHELKIEWAVAPAKTENEAKNPGRFGKQPGIEDLRVAGISEQPSALAWAAANHKLLAIVFTDIVRFTDLGQELKDEATFPLLMAYLDRSQALIRSSDGWRANKAGDGLLTAFLSVTEAFEYVRAFHRDPGHSRLQIRAGIHVGPATVLPDKDLFGGKVNLASRVMGEAKGAQICLSDLAKQFLQQSTTAYDNLPWEHHQTTLKGFEKDGLQTIWSLPLNV